MTQISLPLSKGPYGHHAAGSGPTAVAGIKELTSSGHIFVEISGLLVRDGESKSLMKVQQADTDPSNPHRGNVVMNGRILTTLNKSGVYINLEGEAKKGASISMRPDNQAAIFCWAKFSAARTETIKETQLVRLEYGDEHKTIFASTGSRRKLAGRNGR